MKSINTFEFSGGIFVSTSDSSAFFQERCIADWLRGNEIDGIVWGQVN
jgi:hypothetical protein